jgi:hypothetical protein
MRRDLMKHTIFCDILNTDVDGSFANAAAWNSGQKVIDLWGNNQMVPNLLVFLKISTYSSPATFYLKESADASTYTNAVPYLLAATEYKWKALSATGLYMAEYKGLKRYVKLECDVLAGTNIMYGWVVGTSLRDPIDRTVYTMATL